MAAAKKSRLDRDKRLKPDRSRQLNNIIDALDRQDRNLSWLAKQLKLSRQAVSAWKIVPPEHRDEVARLTGLSKSRIS